jgi:hypothetical protein
MVTLITAVPGNAARRGQPCPVAKDAALGLAELQGDLDRFRAYDNTVGPHWAIGRRTPAEAFGARPKAVPTGQRLSVPVHCRVRRDRIDRCGKLTLRHDSRLHHIGLGRRHAGTRVLLLVADLDVRVLTEDGSCCGT